MPQKGLKVEPLEVLNIDSVSDLIVSLQRDSGDIPWHSDGKTDPWDLVETIMGLNISGQFSASYKAFEWLKKIQNADGSWYSSYMDGVPEDRTCETHMATYFAVGLFHTWLITKNESLLKQMWPTMEKAIEYAISLQTRSGEIYWAKSPEGIVDPMSLLAGSSSIFMSLKCAVSLSVVLGKLRPGWVKACDALGQSIRENRSLYNVSKSRFSMYWFYPILSGALTKAPAEKRIEKHWHKYVIEGQGARCVSDQPWITIAETSELVLTLCAMGKKERAKIVFSWIQDKVYGDQSFWCGYTFPDMVIWPEEKISWTNAVVLMAADALYGLTAASDMFDHAHWDGYLFKGIKS